MQILESDLIPKTNLDAFALQDLQQILARLWSNGDSGGFSDIRLTWLGANWPLQEER